MPNPSAENPAALFGRLQVIRSKYSQIGPDQDTQRLYRGERRELNVEKGGILARLLVACCSKARDHPTKNNSLARIKR